MSWATERLDALKARKAEPPSVVRTLRLGTLDDWGPGWAKKRWEPEPDLLNVDGSLFGGYIAALADQMLTFAAMSVVPEGTGFRTVNLAVQFFRVGREHALDIEARVVSQSKSMIAADADFRRDPDGALIARASAQEFLLPLSPG